MLITGDSMVDVIEFMKATLGPAVAALGVAVAVAQWRTGTIKLRLDSYDRRLRVYKATIGLLDCVLAEVRWRRGPAYRQKSNCFDKPYEDIPADVLAEFDDCLLEASFLFGRDVTRLMYAIRSDMELIQREARGLERKSPFDLSDAITRHDMATLLAVERRIGGVRGRVESAFRRYLRFQKFRK